MKFTVDHDFHIHSELSLCSNDPLQTPLRILQYAKDNNYKELILTDHFWDETVPGASNWYKKQDYEHIRKSLPLPTAEGINYMFGAEIDMDQYGTIGISHKVAEELAFIIVPTTHLHMSGFTIDASIGTETESDWKYRAEQYVKRWDTLLNADLPFEKVGIPHLTCGLMCKGHSKSVLNLISDDTFREMFTRTAKIGMGVELNFNSLAAPREELEWLFRPYRIAMTCGCKFYFGSDAHHEEKLLSAPANFANMVDVLGLEEDMKFHLK